MVYKYNPLNTIGDLRPSIEQNLKEIETALKNTNTSGPGGTAYDLPIATDTDLGGVLIGSGIVEDKTTGKISVTAASIGALPKSETYTKSEIDSAIAAVPSADLTPYIKTVDADNKFALKGAAPVAGSGITEYESVADLRTNAPKENGQLVYVKGYTAGSRTGGGWFISTRVTTPGTFKDDGGYIFTGGNNYNWKWTRTKELNDMTVLDFGAIEGDPTDAATISTNAVTNAAAFKAMALWAKSNPDTALLGIQCPAGDFHVNPIDFGNTSLYLRIKGAGDAVGGYFNRTTLHTVAGQTEPMIKGKFPKTEISGFIVEGPTDSAITVSDVGFNGTSLGKKKNLSEMGFYHNDQPGGQYVTIKCVRLDSLDGIGIYFSDALDTLVEQFFAANCSKSVIKGSWDNAVTGHWDHGTAVSLRKINVQYTHTNGRLDDTIAIDIKRHAQSICEDVWVEHCGATVTPVDFSAGAWYINTLCIESTKLPANMRSVRMIKMMEDRVDSSKDDMSMLNINTKPAFGTMPIDMEFNNIFERGWIHLEPQGIRLKQGASLQMDTHVAPVTLNNESGTTALWFNVGNLMGAQNGESWDVEVIGRAGFNSLHNDSPDGVCRTVIGLQSRSGGVVGSYYNMGSQPAVSAVKLDNDSKVGKGDGSSVTYNTLYIQVPAYTKAAVYVRAGGKGYFDAVVGRNWFEPNGLKYSAADWTSHLAELAAQTPSIVPIDILSQFQFGSTKASVGSDNTSGILKLNGTSISANSKQIKNVADPVDDNDTVNLKYLKAQIKLMQDQIDALKNP